MTRPALPLRYVSPVLPRSCKVAHLLLKCPTEIAYTLCGRQFHEPHVYFSRRDREMCKNCWRVYATGGDITRGDG